MILACYVLVGVCCVFIVLFNAVNSTQLVLVIVLVSCVREKSIRKQYWCVVL